MHFQFFFCKIFLKSVCQLHHSSRGIIILKTRVRRMFQNSPFKTGNFFHGEDDVSQIQTQPLNVQYRRCNMWTYFSNSFNFTLRYSRKLLMNWGHWEGGTSQWPLVRTMYKNYKVLCTLYTYIMCLNLLLILK